MRTTPTPRMLLLACAMATILTGCDYDVPLVEKPEQPMDSALLGLWETKLDNDDTAQLLILPFSKNEYLVAYPAGTPDALYTQTRLCKATEFALVQLKWIGTSHGTSPTERMYQYAAYNVDGDKLTTRLLNPAVAKPVDTAAALLASIKTNNTNPALFRSEMVFTRVKPKPDPTKPPVRPPVPKDWQ